SYLSEDEDIYLQNEKRLTNEGNIEPEDFELVQSENVAEEQNIATNFDEEEITPSRKSSKAENVANDVILKHQDSSSTMTGGSQYSPEGSEAERSSQSTVIRVPSFLPEDFKEEDYAAQKSDDEELVTSETPMTATHPLIFEDERSLINRFDDQEVTTEIKEKKIPEENVLSENAELHRTTEENSKATTGIKDIVDSESVSGDHFESPMIPEQKDISEEAVPRNLESVSGYPETEFTGEASELQKGDEITEEPLQQRPADIPYPLEKEEEKDEPGLATKIAGAVAGVTVG
uniref:Uncharacterized protein n=1 Tax=Panagrolaimus sp. PS1159 TaxID=55785 RepID=A0AC35F2Y8_9BILA